jgi:hypothetical protein
VQYAACFADCQHELTKVQRGRRLVLAYNLVWTSEQAAPAAPGSAAARALLAAVQQWEAELAAGGRRRRLAFALGGCAS